MQLFGKKLYDLTKLLNARFGGMKSAKVHYQKNSNLDPYLIPGCTCCIYIDEVSAYIIY